MVVSSIDAAAQPSSVDPPSHQPTNAAILLNTHTPRVNRTIEQLHTTQLSEQQQTWQEIDHNPLTPTVAIWVQL